MAPTQRSSPLQTLSSFELAMMTSNIFSAEASIILGGVGITRGYNGLYTPYADVHSAPKFKARKK